MNQIARASASLFAAFLLLGVVATMALGSTESVFILKPTKPTDPKAAKEPPPTGYLEGPCGLASVSGQLYVSDYYHHAVDIFGSNGYIAQLPNENSEDGPCQIAVGPVGQLFVNNFHNDVVRYQPSAFPATKGPPPTSFGTGTEVDSAHPTGVAFDPLTSRVYVDDRTYIAAYNLNGTPVMEGLEPLRIGVGEIKSGYGLAVSASGRIYVADAGTSSIKIFDPASDLVHPVATVKGPGKGFTSLRDASVAVDPNNAALYVVDNLQPNYTEAPEAVVDVFNSGGGFLGVLKYRVFDALPAGLATDSSGMVYVTSGNTDQAAVYGYAAGSQTSSALPPTVNATIHVGGMGGGLVTSSSPMISCSAECSSGLLPDTQVTLRATPGTGSTFSGWSGTDCSGGQPTCVVTADEAVTVRADFSPSGVTPPSEPLPAETGTETTPAITRGALRARHRAKHSRHVRHRRHARHQRAQTRK